MAGQAKAWAWEQTIPCGPKFVLVTLVTFADYDGTTAIGQKTLMRLTGFGRTSVHKHLNELEQRGLISRTRRRNDDGTWNQDVFQILSGGPCSDSAPGPCSDSASTSILDLKSSSEGSKNTPHSPPTGGPNRHLKLKPPEPDSEKLEPTDLMEAWNDFAPVELSRVSQLDAGRLKKARDRCKEHPDPDWWSAVFGMMAKSPLLRGLVKPKVDGHKPWRATFDWLIKDSSNCVKVYEGQYLQ